MQYIKENINKLIIKEYFKNAYKIYRLIIKNKVKDLEDFRVKNHLPKDNFLKCLDKDFNELNFEGLKWQFY